MKKSKPCKIDPQTGLPINLPIKFYLYDKYLGIGYISEGSFPEQRRAAAKKLGIHYYNGIIIQNRDLRKMRFLDAKNKIRRDIDFMRHRNYMIKSMSDPDTAGTRKQQKEKRALLIIKMKAAHDFKSGKPFIYPQFIKRK